MVKIKKVFYIDGMTCSGCETRIENALNKMEGIENVKVNFFNSNAEIDYIEDLISEKQIIEKIESLEYTVRTEKNVNKRYTKVDNLDNKKSESIKFIGIIVILVAVYLIVKNTIGFNLIPEVEQSMNYGMLFIIGLLTSLHCVAMCGGINISQCASGKIQDYNSRLMPSLLYNLGRIISYTLIGGIFGAFGSLISISTSSKAIISILSGILMLIMGLNILNIFPFLKKLNFKMPKFLINKFRNSNSKRSPIYVGLLNGLMPCGPLQAMQIYALGTGSFISGAISMLVFGLGTVPLMFGLGALSSFLTYKFNKKMMKVSAALVIVLGIVMISRGFSLSGISLIPSSLDSNEGLNSKNIAVIQDGVQVVTTNLTDGRYTPIIVQKGIPVKWTIKVNKGELNGCNNSINIPKYDKTKKLVLGDNLVEFTPDEVGNVIYTCWMGMISSNIKIVDDLTNVKQSDIDISAPSTSGGCCGL